MVLFECVDGSTSIGILKFTLERFPPRDVNGRRFFPRRLKGVQNMNATHIRPALVAAAVSAMFLTAVPAFAEKVSYKADLKGSAEVPSNTTKGTGALDATYDTTSKKLTWTITSTGLTGAVTAAHFHGPAEAGKNAPPVVPIGGNLASPIKGDATLTDAQAADLQAGRWYLNVHTAAHKDGEIRGQVIKK
jgi:CHRD domain